MRQHASPSSFINPTRRANNNARDDDDDERAQQKAQRPRAHHRLPAA
jgi:hypothetical protein